MTFVSTLFFWFFSMNLVGAWAIGLTPIVKHGELWRFNFRVYAVDAILMLVCVVTLWPLGYLLEVVLPLWYLKIMLYISVICGYAVLLRGLMERASGSLGESLRAHGSSFESLMAPFGLALLLNSACTGVFELIAATVGGILGFGAIQVLHSFVLRRLELAALPKSLRGLPIVFISLGSLSFVSLLMGKLVLGGMFGRLH